MIVFRVLISAFAMAGLFAILWLLIGRLVVKYYNPEDQPIKDWNVQHHLGLEIRRAELRAKKQALQDAQKRLGVVKESVKITEELAQTEISLDKTEQRIEQLDRVRDQNLHIT